MRKINVTPAAYEYLFIQRGDISHIEDRAQWDIAYDAALHAQFASIEAFLPKKDFCRVLDIGGGMGGINILINDHFQQNANITIVDGINDDCVMRRHAETFNNAEIGVEFLVRNGVEEVKYIAPSYDFASDHRFDLVVSFSSYCFHYPPSTYLDRIVRASTPNTVFVFDVRRDRQWEYELENAFGPGRVIAEGRKFQRMVFGGDLQQ